MTTDAAFSKIGNNLKKISGGGWVGIAVAAVVLLVLLDMGKTPNVKYEDPYQIDWMGTILPAAGVLIVLYFILRRVL